MPTLSCLPVAEIAFLKDVRDHPGGGVCRLFNRFYCPYGSPALVAGKRMLRKMVRKELDMAFSVAILSYRLDHEIEADQKYIEFLEPYKRLE